METLGNLGLTLFWSCAAVLIYVYWGYGALLKLMLGDGAGGTRPAGAFVSPTFNLSLRVENQGFPGNTATVTVHGVKLDSWSYELPEDDFVLEQVTFKALWISAADASA